MATYIDTKSIKQASAVSESTHFMPCKIDFDGEAKTSDFFLPSIREASEGSLTAIFRGRPLRGKNIDVPSGYTGAVLTEPHKRSTEEEDRRLVASQTFDKFTYWNLDKEPSPDDPFQRAMQWVDLAAVLHKPVQPEESQNSQESQESMKGK